MARSVGPPGRNLYGLTIPGHARSWYRIAMKHNLHRTGLDECRRQWFRMGLSSHNMLLNCLPEADRGRPLIQPQNAISPRQRFHFARSTLPRCRLSRHCLPGLGGADEGFARYGAFWVLTLHPQGGFGCNTITARQADHARARTAAAVGRLGDAVGFRIPGARHQSRSP